MDFKKVLKPLNLRGILFSKPGSAKSQDDFIVWGKNLQEHDKHLRNVFLKIKENGFKLNKAK